MDAADRKELEARIHAACERGDHADAATLGIKMYGPELLGFLVAVHSNEADASDTFSDVAEALWRGLPTFGWESSFRTWAYAITRNTIHTRRRNGARRERGVVRVGDSALEHVAQGIRTETLSFLRTANRTRLEVLRDSLSQEDQMLLVLRVDQTLGTRCRRPAERRSLRTPRARGGLPQLALRVCEAAR